MQNEKDEMQLKKTENEAKKDFLNSYLEAKKAEKRIEIQIKELQQNKLSPGCFSSDGMPRGSNTSDLSDYAAKLDELEQELWTERYRKLFEFERVQKAIEEMPYEDEKLVLTYKYINNFRWGKIASEMGYAVRSVQYIHGDALKHIHIKK